MEVKCAIAGIVALFIIINVGAQPGNDASLPFQKMPDVLPGTRPLTWQGDLSVKMLDGAHKFIEDKIQVSVSARQRLWNRDFSTQAAYEMSVEPNRQRFMKYIGVVDKSKPPASFNTGIEEKHPDVFMQKIVVDND
ncbi:MAG TPA: hypothetical protein VFO37_14790, partial [Chitinophagaceae bacterium]|nr:hypothetical protein [Chitinophagaceae bacterium]